MYRYIVSVLMLVQVVSCYLEAREVLKMLNVPWEGNCPVTPPLLDLDSLGLIGRCPTKYQILDLPPNSKPNAILQGFCDSSCHNTVCSQWGNFRCMNYTVPVDISMLEVSDSCEEEEEIIANEEVRRVKRLSAHYNNPVWENRPEPPPDWNAPLPPFLEEKLKNTYLDIKARELREGKVLTADRMCTIL